MEYPPQSGEIWINIHTSAKANILAIEDVPGASGGKVVIYGVTPGDRSRCNVPDFQKHWKRFKSASKWNLGVLGALDALD